MLEKLKPLADKIAETSLFDKHHAQKRAEWVIRETDIEKYLKERGQYLDVGTGRGHIVERILSDMEKNGKPLAAYFSLDLKDKPSELVQKREGERKGVEGRNPLSFSRASGDELPFRNQTMDGVSFIFMLHHMSLEAVGASMIEAKRVLKEGGYIFVAEDVVESEEQRKVTLRADRLLNFEGKDAVHNYRSIEGWIEYFGERGLEVVNQKDFSSKSPVGGTVPHHFFALKLQQK